MFTREKGFDKATLGIIDNFWNLRMSQTLNKEFKLNKSFIPSG
jgi:hypothetical protein